MAIPAGLMELAQELADASADVIRPYFRCLGVLLVIWRTLQALSDEVEKMYQAAGNNMPCKHSMALQAT